jgi:ankyrin repeat protein
MEPQINTDFLYAIEDHDFDELDRLIAKTPGFCNTVKPYGRSLIHTSILHGSIETLEYFVRKGCDVNEVDSKGATALHAAAELQDPELVKILTASGADVNCQDNYGNSPLWKAVFSSRDQNEVVTLLCKHRADPHLANHNGMTPYKLALESGRDNLVDIFNQFG